jgi:hypothetical protein
MAQCDEWDAMMQAGPSKTPRVSVVQGGARGHYGLCVALERARMLGEVFTDYYCPPGTVH